MNVAILQARMSSSRLPGKVLKTIVGKPVLALQIERLLRCKNIDKLVIATSINDDDNAIEKLCNQLGIICFRGDLDNVLKRFYDAALLYNASNIIRLTGDCPLADPELIDRVISYHLTGGFEYTSNVFPRTYPDGLDVEVMTLATLEKLNSIANSKEEKEHVTFHIENNLKKYHIGNVSQKNNIADLRWTLDTEQDFQLISNIYQALYHTKPNFNTQDILELSLHE